MAEPLMKKNRLYTYNDYASWPDNERWEIINGEAFCMAPSPLEEHQDVSGELFYEFKRYLRGKECKVYHAPFDLLLPEDGETFDSATNIVQPDIMVVCDRNRRQRRGIYGAPDLVIEILSPSTASNDIKYKFKLYERYGVKEYWIVDPIHKTLHVYKYGKNGRYESPEVYVSSDKVKPGIFEDLEIDLKLVFV